MAENINEVLGIQEAAPQKAPAEKPIYDGQLPSTPKAESSIDNSAENSSGNSAENTLKGIAAIVLILGIIATIICFSTLCFVEKGHYVSRIEFSAAGLVPTFATLLTSLAAWAVMRVLANISLTLKDINSKIKRQ